MTQSPRSCVDEDTARGGFGGAPKFPPSALLEALLRHYERTRDPSSLGAVQRSAAAMARGGIYDQLAGGFARYSVDASWVVPHFEKMLYDNALLLRAYAHWARRTGDPLARRIAAETADFLRDALQEGGMFTSSLDADAAGSEGSTYVWTPGELREVLGEDDARWAATVFEVTDAGTFEHGSSVLQLLSDPDDTQRFERVRTALLAARAGRVQPDRDDKVVTAWNGLAITALAEAGIALNRADLVDAARRCGDALLILHLVNGRLRRASLGGVVGESPAILEDYGGIVDRPADPASGHRRSVVVDGRDRAARYRAGTVRPTLTRRDGGTTPPPMPSSWCCARPIRSTAPLRRARRSSPRRC